MRGRRGVAVWLVSIGLSGSMGVLLLLPVWLTATLAPDPGAVLLSPEPGSYDLTLPEPQGEGRLRE